MCVFGAICDFWAFFCDLGGFCVELVYFIVFDVKIKHRANFGQKTMILEKCTDEIKIVEEKNGFLIY